MIISKDKKGFALLYALLLTGAILVVGVILMNIITKQLVYSSINKQSELAYYYAANSGRECLADAIKKGEFLIDPGALYLKTKGSVSLTCFGLSQPITLTADSSGTFNSDPSVPVKFNGAKVDLAVYINEDCLNSGPNCNTQSKDLKTANSYLAIATGYSSANSSRAVKRSAVFVQP